ncbi:MAG: hypothetical protein GYB31_10810 [Bacteroidetes bacterium]|nr:hypothetical protein [Bacteroidota bacterium]
MQTQEIQSLIDRYYLGETSLEEERQLKNYFSGKEVAPELSVHQHLFSGLKQMQQDALSADFESRLLKQLQEEKPKAKVVSMRMQFLRVAAAVVLLLSLWFLIPDTQQSSDPQAIDWSAYEVSEEESLEETLAAMKILSDALNSGKKKVKKEINHVDRMNDPIK